MILDFQNKKYEVKFYNKEAYIVNVCEMKIPNQNVLLLYSIKNKEGIYFAIGKEV